MPLDPEANLVLQIFDRAKVYAEHLQESPCLRTTGFVIQYKAVPPQLLLDTYWFVTAR
jgi:hypothetical protein